MAHMMQAEGLFVLADRENSVFDGQIFAGEDEVDAGVGGGPRDVDAADASVRARGAEEGAGDQAGEGKVSGEAGLPGDFGAGIHVAAWMANYAEFAIISVGLFLWGIFLLRHRR